MKKILLLILATLLALPSFARDFEYTYAGQTLTYTVIDEDAKTCKTKDGDIDCGNYGLGYLKIPSIAKDGNIEYSVIAIGDNGFRMCSTLSSVSIPNSVITIGDFAFLGCDGLYSVIIPNSVVTIGDLAFCGCSNLSELTIGNSVKTIRIMAFCECAIMEVTIPNSVTEIGACAFEDCKNLTSVTIGNSVKIIKECAFDGCSNLNKVEFPSIESVCSITYEYFDTYEYYNANPLFYGHHLYINGEEVTDLVIPDTVEKIKMLTFFGCNNISSVTIGNSVKEIGSSAFGGCSSINEVISHSIVPPTLYDRGFDKEIYDTAKLTVPEAALYAYRKTNWSLFKNIATSGVEDAVVDGEEIDFEAPFEVYDFRGVRVGCKIDALHAGIYILRQGDKVKKIAVN